jgi:hypothetical protein
MGPTEPLRPVVKGTVNNAIATATADSDERM